MIRRAYALAALLLLPVPVSGAAASGVPNSAERGRIDAVFKNYTARSPGCALGVFRNGGIWYARGYGMADLERNVPITPASVFEVGSVSKQFAAAAIALLVQDGKIAFTDDVRKYIPELPDYGAPITLNELVWHTSGLRDYTDLLDLAGYGLEQATTDSQALALILRQRALEFPSGTQYEYSNTNYFLLSVIVKRVTGESLAQFARRRIFTPLQMTHTLYRTDYAMLVPMRALGYAPAGNGTFRNSMSNWQQTGDGGVQIPIDDAVKWDENFYNPVVGGKRLTATLQAPGHLANGTPLHYGRGLFLGTYRGLRLVSHGGAWIGYRAAFDRYPSVHTSVVVLCNSDAGPAQTLARSVADIVLGNSLGPVKRSASVSTHARVKAAAFIGAYLDDAGGDIYRVSTSGNGIALQGSGAAYPLVPTGASTFTFGGGATVRFDIGKDGLATGMQIDTGGDDRRYAKRFTPASPTAANLTGASGNYHSADLDVTWTLHANGATVALVPSRNLPDGAAGPLHAQTANLFTSDGGFSIRFTRDAAGRIDGFILSAGRGLRSIPFTLLR